LPTSRLPVTPFIHGHLDVFAFVEEEQETPWISGHRLHERPDVLAAYEPQIGPHPHISRSGFDVTAPLPPGVRTDSSTVISIQPHAPDGRPLDSLHTYFCDFENELRTRPQPPVHLQERIGGSKDFLQVAAQLVTLLLTCIGKRRSLFAPASVLDWGCGCGRVLAQMMHFFPPERLSGCDIDAAAIAWDQGHIRGPSFSRVGPYPPTNYPDQSFDIVYGISVMTHLAEEAQISWLKELKRITRPKAILALSVIGQQLREANMPASLAPEFARKGFAAFVPAYSEMLTEFSHEGYYQETYHSLDYIVSTWGEYFDVLEVVETKHQDVVLLGAR
jgi:2-polyprenyl-3-methyl-5-hydroxy-6-metoxy-1,4-benzoquinol methylase